jgi:hypothetical protein
MKKSFFAAVMIIIALLFSGCAAPVKTISYDYKFGYNSIAEEGLLERFEYNITSDNDLSGTETKPPFIIVEDDQYNSTYTVDLYKEEEAYLFKIVTKLDFKGKYYFPSTDSYSPVFSDNITTTSYAYIETKALIPKSTEKICETSIPLTLNEQYIVKKAYYRVNTVYEQNGGKIKATSTVTDTRPDDADSYKVQTEANKNFTFETSERLIDNEFIFSAIRLQNLTTSFTDSFKVVDPLSGVVQQINAQAGQNLEKQEFTDPADEENLKDYDCVAVSANINAKYTGKNVVMYFTTDYSITYLSEGEQIPINISLMLKIKQENLIFALVSYENFAEKPPK